MLKTMKLKKVFLGVEPKFLSKMAKKGLDTMQLFACRIAPTSYRGEWDKIAENEKVNYFKIRDL